MNGSMDADQDLGQDREQSGRAEQDARPRSGRDQGGPPWLVGLPGPPSVTSGWVNW